MDCTCRSVLRGARLRTLPQPVHDERLEVALTPRVEPGRDHFRTAAPAARGVPQQHVVVGEQPLQRAVEGGVALGWAGGVAHALEHVDRRVRPRLVEGVVDLRDVRERRLEDVLDRHAVDRSPALAGVTTRQLRHLA